MLSVHIAGVETCSCGELSERSVSVSMCRDHFEVTNFVACFLAVFFLFPMKTPFTDVVQALMLPACVSEALGDSCFNRRRSFLLAPVRDVYADFGYEIIVMCENRLQIAHERKAIRDQQPHFAHRELAHRELRPYAKFFLS